jgi:hypothetical protein
MSGYWSGNLFGFRQIFIPSAGTFRPSPGFIVSLGFIDIQPEEKLDEVLGLRTTSGIKLKHCLEDVLHGPPQGMIDIVQGR